MNLIYIQIARLPLNQERDNMSLKTLEAAIVREMKDITKNRKLALKNLMEWRTSKIADSEIQQGETKVFLPVLKIWAVYKETI